VNNLFDYFQLGPLHRIHGDAQSIQITFSSRRKKPFAPGGAAIGRIIQNEADLIEAIRKIPGVKVEVREFFEMEFLDQLELFRQTDILIGMHGAGLANLVYTPLDAAIIELIPFTWTSPEYFNLAGITGRSYYQWRNTHKNKHIEPDCYQLASKNSIEGENVCRTGTSTTIATVDEVMAVVQQAIKELKSKRRTEK
jgi:capsular polysaccharide biosynthesis protein